MTTTTTSQISLSYITSWPQNGLVSRLKLRIRRRRHADDSLDEPLHLLILTSLASNLAQIPVADQREPTGQTDSSDGPQTAGDHAHILLDGLPALSKTSSETEGEEDDEDWVS